MKKLTFIILALSLLSSILFSFQLDNLQKAKQLIKEKKFEEAKILLDEIIENDDQNHKAYFNLGKVNLFVKNYEESSENFEEAINLFDENADYHFWLGRSYGMEAQEASFISQAMLASDIIEQFERAIELDPTHVQGKIGVINFHISAPGIMGGDMDIAKLNAKEFIKLNEYKGRVALARIYLKEENIDSVEIQMKVLENKFELDKSAVSFYNELGYYYLNENQIDKAIVVFEKQVKLNPENANSYDSLGDGYKAAGRVEDAIKQYKKALEIEPNFSASINNLEELQEKIKSK
jgi:tetratricopeptide (TPR) repeat protein